MNEFYRSFVRDARAAAERAGLTWNPPFDGGGNIERELRWNLTALAGLVPPPTLWMSSFAVPETALTPLRTVLEPRGIPTSIPWVLSGTWREFYQAVVATEILIKKRKPIHALANVGKLIRVLGACCGDREPWDLTAEDVMLAYNVALRTGKSGKVASNLEMVIRVVIDAGYLADRSPLAKFCRPYPDDDANEGERRVMALRKTANSYKLTEPLRKDLAARRRDDRLPGERAFWELTRIVFTEKPKNLMDAVRFVQMRIAVITGFRVGEHGAIPHDWRRWREYLDRRGRPAGESGGISRSLMIRYFAEKQDQDTDERGFVLYETAQHVPPIFEDVVQDTLDYVADITRPLRERLRRQVETGRLIPEHPPDALIPAYEAYVRAVGNINFTDEPIPDHLAVRYRERFSADDLTPIWDHQVHSLMRGAYVITSFKEFFGVQRRDVLPLRDRLGSVMVGKVARWTDAYVRVGDLEAFVRKFLPTKLPNLLPFSLADGGYLHPHELLFLMPVRALAEGRNNGITDVTRYLSAGRISTQDIQGHLGGDADNNFFVRYLGEAGRGLSVNTHAIRHLQNSELLRLGVADAIVTKRFRKSQVQTSAYDHRSLAEDLAAIDLPPEVEEKLGPRAAETFRLIRAGRVSGPVVEEFRSIQRELGDDAAFEYLAAEADGLHVTPYGLCLNSFTVDPCPKHLECFAGCLHLGRTDRSDERANLERLRARLHAVVAKLEATPAERRKFGYKNQLRHAQERLSGVEAALRARPGDRVFPDGVDLFSPIGDRLGRTVLDMKKGPIRAED